MSYFCPCKQFVVVGETSNKYYLLNAKYTVLNHFAFWIAYLLYSGLIQHFGTGFGDYRVFPVIFIIDFICVYFTLHFLIPRFIVKKQNLVNFFLYVLLIIFLNLALNFVLQNFVVGDGVESLYKCLERQAYSFQFSLVFILVAIGIKVFKINLSNSEEIRRLEKEKITSELDFLKNQINPHFLFNVLNNIYIQTRIEPKKSADMILKLSDLLRYQLYECSQDKVMLKSEVDYLKNYVELQKMRLSKIDIKFEQKGSFQGLMIYPFMFIPFLENSFKHGVSSKGVNNFIYIFVEIVEKNVIFVVKNSKIDTSNNSLKKQGGIGLKNIERRLELLYKDNYELKIEDREENYNVELKISLK